MKTYAHIFVQVLLDSLKRKTYDDELRREEILNYFRRFQAASQKVLFSVLFNPSLPRKKNV